MQDKSLSYSTGLNWDGDWRYPDIRYDRGQPEREMNEGRTGEESGDDLSFLIPDPNQVHFLLFPQVRQQTFHHLYRPVNQLVQLRVVFFAACSAFSARTSNCPGTGAPVFAFAASKAC